MAFIHTLDRHARAGHLRSVLSELRWTQSAPIDGREQWAFSAANARLQAIIDERSLRVDWRAGEFPCLSQANSKKKYRSLD